MKILQACVQPSAYMSLSHERKDITQQHCLSAMDQVQPCQCLSSKPVWVSEKQFAAIPVYHCLAEHNRPQTMKRHLYWDSCVAESISPAMSCVVGGRGLAKVRNWACIWSCTYGKGLPSFYHLNAPAMRMLPSIWNGTKILSVKRS